MWAALSERWAVAGMQSAERCGQEYTRLDNGVPLSGGVKQFPRVFETAPGVMKEQGKP